MDGRTSTDHIPPYSEQAERGVLGSILLDWVRVMDLCVTAGLDGTAFYVPAYHSIWDACLSLHNDRKPVDLLTVSDKLRDSGELDRIGGSVFIDRLVDATPTAANAEWYIDIVNKKWLARKLIDAARDAESAIYGGDDPQEVVASHMHALNMLEKEDNTHPTKEGIWEQCKANAKLAKEGKAVGLPSPWETFNRDTGGAVHAGVTLVVGAGGTRKSYLVNQWGLHAAVVEGIPGVYYPFEDGPTRSMSRSVCLLAGVDNYKWSRGNYTPEAEEAMAAAFKRLNASPFEIRGGRSLSLTQRRLELARGVSKHGWKFCVFDAFKDMMRNGEDLKEQATTIAWAADMAEEFDMPVIVTHHVNKGSKAEAGDVEAERIKKRDVRGILSIWDASRMVVALQCQKKLTNRGRPVYTNYVLDCIKSNYGPLGACSLNINHGTGAFTSAIRKPFSDWTTNEYETIESHEKEEGDDAF